MVITREQLSKLDEFTIGLIASGQYSLYNNTENDYLLQVSGGVFYQLGLDGEVLGKVPYNGEHLEPVYFDDVVRSANPSALNFCKDYCHL